MSFNNPYKNGTYEYMVWDFYNDIKDNYYHFKLLSCLCNRFIDNNTSDDIKNNYTRLIKLNEIRHIRINHYVYPHEYKNQDIDFKAVTEYLKELDNKMEKLIDVIDFSLLVDFVKSHIDESILEMDITEEN